MTRVMILDADYDSLAGPIAGVFDSFAPDLENKKVLVKPNMLSARRPDEHVTTHPSLVKAVTRELIRRHARVTVGDNHSTEGTMLNEEVARVTQIADASLGHFRNISKAARIVKGFSTLVDEVMVSTDVLECQYLVNLPKFKTHALTTITGALKNMYGIVPGTAKSRLHFRCAQPRHFAQIIVDLYRIRPPDLTIMDAVIGMEGLGPGNGKLRPIGKLIASTNGAAVDVIMARMMGAKPESIGHLKLAIEQGLVDPERIEIDGEVKSLKRFEMPPTFIRGGFPRFVFSAAQYLYGKVVHGYQVGRFPVLELGRCRQCGSCINICPAEALGRVEDGYPKINYSKCMLCYCCIEVCPHNAIRPRPRMLRRKS